MKIEVLGAGCKKCQALEHQTRATLAELGVEAEVEHVTEMRRIMGYGVLSTPALVIDGKVKCAGRLPAADELRQWLQPQPGN
jgi:small redox-active disulfide protein 2